jgi:protein pelota
MKILKKRVDKNGEGSITVRCEDAEDMWVLYNIIQVGDQLRATTTRGIIRTSATGSVTKERRTLTMILSIIELPKFDAQGCCVSIKGLNCQQMEDVPIGANHSMTLEVNKDIGITKTFWDSHAFQLLQQAADVALKADAAAVIMEEGLAHICLLSSSMSLTLATVDSPIPRKTGAVTAQRGKAVTKFHDGVLTAILQHIDFTKSKALIIASPGFVKDIFFEWLMSEAARRQLKQITGFREKILLVHCSAGHKHCLKEVMADPSSAAALSNCKAMQETKAIQDFDSMMIQDDRRAVYGKAQVAAAVDMGAVQTLLITDGMFRTENVDDRNSYVAMMDTVRNAGSAVLILSTQHVSGERLQSLCGLRFSRFPKFLRNHLLQELLQFYAFPLNSMQMMTSKA